jgi:hypothetical protein
MASMGRASAQHGVFDMNWLMIATDVLSMLTSIHMYGTQSYQARNNDP